jgi:hypothetical protein
VSQQSFGCSKIGLPPFFAKAALCPAVYSDLCSTALVMPGGFSAGQTENQLRNPIDAPTKLGEVVLRLNRLSIVPYRSGFKSIALLACQPYKS